MTTTYDAESTCDTIAAVYYDDPDTYTIAEAWMSSPLGGLDDDITDAYVSADPDDDRDRGGSRGKLFAAAAAGIIGGATLGAVLFGYRPVAPPTVVVPGFGVSTEQLPGTSTTPSNHQTPQKPVAAQAPAPKQLPQSTPNPGAAEAKTNQEVAAAPAAPPVIAPPVVVDVYLPPLGDKPKPQPPAPDDPPVPKPPVFNPGNIEVAQIPAPEDEKSRWQINPDVEKQPGRMATEFPNNEPKRTQLNTNTGSRFTVKIKP